MKNTELVYFTKPSTLDQFLKLGSIVRGVLGGSSPEGGATSENNEVGGSA